MKREVGHEGEGDDEPPFGSVGSRKNCQSGGTGGSELEKGSVYQRARCMTLR